MSGKTIRGPVGITVTLGSSHYKSPLTITGAGRIDPGAYGAVGIYLPELDTLATIVNRGVVSGSNGAYGHTGQAGGNGIDLNSAATVTNSGLIAGGYGGDSNYAGGAGGIGIDVQANATIANSGNIFGGEGSYGFYTGGIGGDGVVLGVAATLANSGAILAGSGGRTYAYSMYAYRTITGGIGVVAGDSAKITNTGHIGGGNGGFTNQDSTYQVVGNSGGAGMSLGDASTLTNSGTITGGDGGSNGNATESGGYGGDGLDLTAATASNSGLITGGAGNYGFSDGGVGGNGVVVSDYGAFTNTGKVVGGAGGLSNVRYGGAGGIGLEIFSDAKATNKGNITGGAGGAGGTGAIFGDGGLQGGAGVYVYSGLLINSATITGGAGATTPGDTGNNTMHHDNAGYGGDGIILGGFGSSPGFGTLAVVNYGVVRGGVAGDIISDQGTAGVGGIGAYVQYGILTNHGTIIGGEGGDVGTGSATEIVPGAGGAGVQLGSGTLINLGTIQGGAGGTDIYTGASGGAGVVVTGGTFIDNGLVRGGAGGSSQTKGATGLAVYLTSGTLVVDSGASFVGNVVANGSGDVLEVSGSSATPLTGFGTQFTGFDAISLAAGTTRALEGAFSSNTAITGFTTNDSIILDGYAANPALSEIGQGFVYLAGSSGNATLKLSLLQAKDLIISVASGKTTVTAASGTTAHTIGAKTAQLVVSGGTATGSLIEAGGVSTIYAGGVTAHPTLAGGTLVLEAGAMVTSGMSFSSATGGELVIDSTTMPTAAISGFIAGDEIKLTNISYNKSDFVTVGTAGFVTITGPGTVEILSITGAVKGETDYKFAAGSVLTRVAAEPKMAFVAPAAALPAAQEPGFEKLFAVETAKLAPPAVALTTLHVPAAALHHGLEQAGFIASFHAELGALAGHPALLVI